MVQQRMSDRPSTQTAEAGMNIRWDDSNMRSVYANVCNVAGTREEITLLLGVHQAWQTGQKEVAVQLQERVILNPFAAKRLNILLSRVLDSYESRYGGLQLQRPAQRGPGESLPSS
jgi:hypothetical protein